MYNYSDDKKNFDIYLINIINTIEKYLLDSKYLM